MHHHSLTIGDIFVEIRLRKYFYLHVCFTAQLHKSTHFVNTAVITGASEQITAMPVCNSSISV